MRTANVTRETRETQISVQVNVDGSGQHQVDTEVKFLTHLLELLATHSLFDITVHARGDLVHHLVEDVALTLGQALNQALGDRTGIARFGWAMVPLDESLAYASVDLARRPYHVIDLKIDKNGVEDMAREDIYHFTRSLATAMEATVHIIVQHGDNDHHKIESGIKALAWALRQAVAHDPRRSGVPSSKGVI
ncbi:MAG: imidazoleglycerol-phosphate dehydratase HisB [Acidobacteriota bacterium]|nr:imidazoleglycerol-phosphate dehydratase HisB [Blastocatellia bacterium]MDW8239842.1 imidazoleglycerol-phosphate dehydratase HisB [Acidobacteriota bacterium]